MSNTQSYHWLASLLSLWLAVSYLWLALFYPLMCSPSSLGSTYTVIDSTATDHTTTEESGSGLLEQSNTEPVTITSNASANGAFLIDTYNHGAAFALTFISVIAAPLLSWLDSNSPTRLIPYFAVAYQAQFHTSPPEQPPRFFLN